MEGKDVPVVEFMRHALLLSSISLDIDDITDLEVGQISRQFDGAVLCLHIIEQSRIPDLTVTHP